MRLQVLSIAAAMASGAFAAQLQQVTSFGENPTNIQMYEYVPDTLGDGAPIIVNVSHLTVYTRGLGFLNEPLPVPRAR